jgi:LysR family glycine cleavage system transcriptional activator
MIPDALARFPLLSLRHLEAAIRLRTFELAAKELNVTPSAVSQQIKHIEASLGQPLFERSANRVSPNERAVELGQVLSEAFELLRVGLQQAMTDTRTQSIKIRLYQTWANRWLVPRLETFTRVFPDIAVEFETGMGPVDFSRTDADLALSTEAAQSRSIAGQVVMVPRLTPVCTPEVAERLRAPEDLAHVARIASRNRMSDWPLWLEAEGQPQLDQRPLLVFSNSTLVYQSALSGAGVAIAQLELVLSDLEAGRLVRPFTRTTPSDSPIFLFEHEVRTRRPSVRKFRSWMLDEIEALVARADAYLQPGT